MTEPSPGLRNVLDVKVEKTKRKVSWSVTDTVIIQACEEKNMRADEAYRCLLQLEGYNPIKIGIKVSCSDFRMTNTTKQGLEESSKNQAQA